MKRKIDKVALARRFATRMSDALGPAKLAKVVSRNAARTLNDDCASLKFVDTAMIMVMALYELYPKASTKNEAEMLIVLEAWEMARLAGYQADAIHGPEQDRRSSKHRIIPSVKVGEAS